jgi:hypothetical protein
VDNYQWPRHIQPIFNLKTFMFLEWQFDKGLDCSHITWNTRLCLSCLGEKGKTSTSYGIDLLEGLGLSLFSSSFRWWAVYFNFTGPFCRFEHLFRVSCRPKTTNFLIFKVNSTEYLCLQVPQVILLLIWLRNGHSDFVMSSTATYDAVVTWIVTRKWL